MGYGTLMVHSVVVIPKLRDYKSSEPVGEAKKSGVEIEEKTDFESIFKKAMKK